ncbi:hypothetical protein FPZ24_15935 [Sphingomonas panacisoli]|uniref:SMODS and SLOG-associating 2TM effector domain-containing protein n=1 Tax=Sphingomonas panacisoli TaxID=1813879 RepID=A0A5B8LMY9_9SPHN|nr:hypothetical protein [Sphingomonas panacisoli]QDZ08772.1 hypothetical protein FPZ24_15935 [Sphingomonas panacisoli]
MTEPVSEPSIESAGLAPREKLGIGVTGHRLDRLGADNVPAVTDALTALFLQIDRIARTQAPNDLRLITGLAEGADCIAADCAVARGWALDVVLPFFRDDFAEDFEEGVARAHFLSRLAASTAILELPGERDAPGGQGVAYERAGRVVLSQCDILVAVWDGEPIRGRGGAAQIVAEAVLQGIPVIHIDPADTQSPKLLWDGLEELDLGQQSVETVARGDLNGLPGLIRGLLDPPSDPDSRAILDRLGAQRGSRWAIAFGYPMLLAIMGIRRPKRSDFTRRIRLGAPAGIPTANCSADTAFAGALRDELAPRFAQADAVATRTAQLFRSVYVTNFLLAALAVVLSLLGLALPASTKPLLITLELVTIAAILIQTRVGNRAAWHRLWLDNRALAEQLRCLAISAQLGDLDLRETSARAAGWVNWYARGTSRDLGLPSGRVDAAYLGCVRDSLIALIDDQVAYLASDADRMHRLEHRLHMLGTVMFGLTVVTCIGLLMFKAADAMIHSLDMLAQPLTIAATIISAALPAVGAAIYGIRMQGDFAGIAERNHALGEQLATMRKVIAEDDLTFDTLSRRVRRVTGLLTDGLASWLRTYHARPLALPG